MTELVAALTDLCKAATKYLHTQAQGGEASVPTRRAPKEKTTSVPPVNDRPAAAAAEMTEEQSTAKLRELCNRFVKQYESATPNGVDQIRNLLVARFNVAKLSDLSHAQRLAVIAEVEKALAQTAAAVA